MNVDPTRWRGPGRAAQSEVGASAAAENGPPPRLR